HCAAAVRLGSQPTFAAFAQIVQKRPLVER
ncbi:MAG: hypothetical protein ACI9BH_002668, partial [Paracoccaceae bacterium]